MGDHDDLSEQDLEDAALLGVLLDDYPAHLATAELVGELAWPSLGVDDALGRLARAGLVHRCGDFAFATRAAVRCRALTL